MAAWLRGCLSAGCSIPAQRSATSSASDLATVAVGHDGVAALPFYSKASVDPAAGESCAAVKVMGQCSCKDGTSTPGCNPADSSTWLVMNDPDFRMLPGGLSLTCSEAAASLKSERGACVCTVHA